MLVLHSDPYTILLGQGRMESGGGGWRHHANEVMITEEWGRTPDGRLAVLCRRSILEAKDVA